MSIVLNLYRQNLINRKNNAQLQLMQNHARMLNFLGTHQGKLSDPNPAAVLENRLAFQNNCASTELMMANCELAALENSSLNYLA